jgi:anti-anti-sigma factor
MTEAFAPLACVDVSGGDPPVVAIIGEIDQSNEEELWRQLEPLEIEGDVVCLDLGEITFLASAGLNLLVRLRRALEGSGRRLEIIAASRSVRRAAEVAGLAATLGLPGPS